MVKALVVEDEEGIRNLLVEQLLDKGCQVRKANNGAVALQLVRDELPDIIYVDIVMPVMDGVAAFHEIKKQYPDKDIKIICITASTLYQEEKNI